MVEWQSEMFDPERPLETDITKAESTHRLGPILILRDLMQS